jgi:hypothetical protein
LFPGMYAGYIRSYPGRTAMKTRTPLFPLVFCLILAACNFPTATQSAPDEDELDFDLSSSRESDFDHQDFAGLGFTWDEEMPGGAIHFTGTIGTCHLSGSWDVLLAVTGNLGPENFLHLVGEGTVEIPQAAEDKFFGSFELPMHGTLTDPDCLVTYDLVMRMTIEITPYSLEIIQAVAGSQAIQASCPDLGTGYDPPPLTFPTDFVVGPMTGTFACDE